MSDTSDTIDYEVQEVEKPRRGRGRGRGRGRHTADATQRSPSTSRPRGRSRSRSTGGRSRGGARGRGRGRGTSSAAVSKSDRERIQEMREKRRQETQELVQRMEENQLRELVIQLVDREPSLVFSLCEGAGGPELSRRSSTLPSWCKCNNCIEMDTDMERKCCGCLPVNCVSLRQEMDRLVLDPQVLALGNAYQQDMLGRVGQRIDDYNRHMRHSGYRNFTLWRHGRLGQGRRRVIPSCCVKKIRESYPSSTNTYTGFIPGRYV